jgi:DNA-binding transcriptional MerR regulator
MFRIGEFARFTRVSVKMLRHYDEIGLLPPAHVDPATGYRFYDVDQLPRLNRIVLLRDLGFGLDAIGAMLRDGDPADDSALDEVYEQRERELAEALTGTRTRLDGVRARRAMLRDGGPAADVVVRPVPAQLVATLSGRPGNDVEPLFNRLEEYVRGHGGRAARPPCCLLGDDAVTVAVPLSWRVPPRGRIAVGSLPAVERMACTVHSGGYGGLAYRLQQMLRWLAATGHRPGGPIREVYLRFGAEPDLALPEAYLARPGTEYVTELQVPLTA